MNWGKGLILGMGLFMTFITVLGIFMFRASPGDYDHQYYEKGLAYDSVYAKERQVIIDKATPHIKLQKDLMSIHFAEAASGTLRFERPSDPSLDQTVTFNADGVNPLNIPLNKFVTGQWQLTLDWKSNGKKYLYDREMYLP